MAAGKFVKVVMAAVLVFVLVGCDNPTDNNGGGSGGSFKDTRDGKTYKKVTIGNQTWMAENLNYQSSSGNSWCYSGTDYSSGTGMFISDGCSKYGRLYDWNTAMDGKSSSSSSPSGVQGVCPLGWHLPSNAEWTTLVNYVGGSSTAGTKLKSSTGWRNSYSGVPAGTDNYGFSALPGGSRDIDGIFYFAGLHGYWWTATERYSGDVYDWGMYNVNENVDDDKSDNSYGLSVRCVMD